MAPASETTPLRDDVHGRRNGAPTARHEPATTDPRRRTTEVGTSAGADGTAEADAIAEAVEFVTLLSASSLGTEAARRARR